LQQITKGRLMCFEQGEHKDDIDWICCRKMEAAVIRQEGQTEL